MIVTRAEILVYLGLAASVTEKQLAAITLLHPMAEAAIRDELQNDVERATHLEFLPISDRAQNTEPLLENDIEVRTGSFAFRSAGRFSDVLQLKHTPVVLDDTLEVREDSGAMGGQVEGSFAESTKLARGTDYWLEVTEVLGEEQISRTGHLRRQSSWSSETGSVKVRYTGGWSREQLDRGPALGIKEATLITAARNFKQAVIQQDLKGGPVVGETIGKYSVQYASQLLANFNWTVSIPAEVSQKLQKFRNYGRLFV